MRETILPKLAVAAVLAALGLSASGCSVVDAVAHHEESAEFADVDTLRSDGDLTIPWIPADGSAIRVTQSTEADAGDASVAVDSEEALSTELCTEVPRQSAPSFTIDDTVDVYGVSSVFACGEWSVAETPSGWLGWTPNHPEEKAQSPSS